jgi:hypothetical protein
MNHPRRGVSLAVGRAALSAPGWALGEVNAGWRVPRGAVRTPRPTRRLSGFDRMLTKTKNLVISVLFVSFNAAFAQEFPEKDLRAKPPQNVNTPRTFPEISSKLEWEQRAQQIREQILVSCGLWPMPEKTPLNAKIFGRIERDGYSVEKVYFQSYPGFTSAEICIGHSGKGKVLFPES